MSWDVVQLGEQGLAEAQQTLDRLGPSYLELGNVDSYQVAMLQMAQSG